MTMKIAKKYGRLYTWKTAQKVCPTGWHLPSSAEFEMLLENARASSGRIAGKFLRVVGWTTGTDKYGFKALPAGSYDGQNKKFYNLGYGSHYWASTDDSQFFANGLFFEGYEVYVNSDSKLNGNSLRCLKDSN